MGTQGEIYVVYGLEVDATVLYEPGEDQNPVVYGINGRAFCDDEDELPVLDRMVHTEVKYAGISSCGYGALDLKKAELSVRPLGHSGEHCGDMGARHFGDGLGNKIGKKGKALVGYAVCNESYMGKSSALPAMNQIVTLNDKLIAEIKEKLGLDIDPSELGLHLMFDWLQGY